jgi:hypothetical protein
MLYYYDFYSKDIESTAFAFMLNKANIYLQNLEFKEHYLQYFDIFSYDYLFNYFASLESFYGYRLLMKTPLVKFKRGFSFGRLSYEEYKPMMENVY